MFVGGQEFVLDLNVLSYFESHESQVLMKQLSDLADNSHSYDIISILWASGLLREMVDERKNMWYEMLVILTTAVIAPHGMTDLIHTENNNKIMQLFRINILSVASSMLFQMSNLDTITNILFMTSSAIHFRHDFPIKNEFLKLCAGSFLVLNAEKIGMELFILHICVLFMYYVPNHYSIYKNMMKEERKFFQIF